MNPPPQAGKPHRHIGWVLLSPTHAAQPSTRIAALNMMSDLTAHGYRSTILFAPEQPQERPQLPPLEALIQQHELDVVIFQKAHGDSVMDLNAGLRTRGIKTVYMVCDLVLPEMTEATDLTVTVTPFLRDLYPAPLRHKVTVVHDGIEHAELHKDSYGDRTGRQDAPLSAVLVTSAALHDLGPIGTPPPWLRATVIGRYPERQSVRQRFRDLAGLEGTATRLDYLRFAGHPRIRTEGWTERRAYDALLAADIGIIPIPTQPGAVMGGAPPMWMRKSENRLTMKMALGLPVVASPVPSYLDVVEHGVNGFIAATSADWTRCLAELRDPGLRRSMGTRARQSVLERFSRNRQSTLLAGALDELLNESRSRQPPHPIHP